MAGEWNEAIWFDLADYVGLDMDACYEYEQSIIPSDGNAASRDLSPDSGDHATDRVEEGSFSPTTLRPNEGLDSSKGKGPSNHNQDCAKAGTEHSEGSPSKCSSLSKAIRHRTTASPGSHRSETPLASGDRQSLVTPAKYMVEHAFPADSTIPSQGSPTDGGGYNPEFSFLEGLASSHETLSFDYFSSSRAQLKNLGKHQVTTSSLKRSHEGFGAR